MNFRNIFIFFLISTAICSGIGFAGDRGKTIVEITADPQDGVGPMKVHIKPKLVNLRTPARYKWSFDGKESAEKEPGFHVFQSGKYSVILEVIDASGKKYTASTSVHAALPG